METIERKYIVYNYDELSEDAKERALEKLYDINVDFGEWYDSDSYAEKAKEYGVEILMSEASFDLDRGDFLYFETYNHQSKPNYRKGISVIDDRKFMQKAGIRWRSVYTDSLTIDHKHYSGGSGANTIECSAELKGEQEGQMTACLEELIGELLSMLRKDYEYLTSREAIEETIRANEYTFLENGQLFF